MTDWSPIFISMKTASLSILVTFFLGLIVAWILIKIKNDTVKIVLDGVFTLPLVLPPTVVGFFLLYIFGVRGPIGKFFLDFFTVKIAFSWTATNFLESSICKCLAGNYQWRNSCLCSWFR